MAKSRRLRLSGGLIGGLVSYIIDVDEENGDTHKLRTRFAELQFSKARENIASTGIERKLL
jgi:hypothetical protein